MHNGIGEIISEVTTRHRDTPQNEVRIFQSIPSIGLDGFCQTIALDSGDSTIIGFAEQPLSPTTNGRIALLVALLGDKRLT